MKTADYDFALPERLIAMRPAERRDGSRLLVLQRDGRREHRTFADLPSYLNAGDMLILNKTKVLPARLTGHKPTGGRLEILLVNEISDGIWNILSRGRYTGPLRVFGNITAHISEGKRASFEDPSGLRSLMWDRGDMPLPPYIKRLPDAKDKERYQTVYAEVEGSIAAPTAGLHFTGELLHGLEAKSVKVRTVTLHVGIGTFKLITSEDLGDHRMDKEFFEIPSGLVSEIEEVRSQGKRVVAVGTTATRAVEGYLSGRCETITANGTIRGSTDIFISDGYRPKAVNSLITNFHLPRSTPLMLASVFAGRERLLAAYGEAIAMEYRFFSYGDAMLVL